MLDLQNSSKTAMAILVESVRDSPAAFSDDSSASGSCIVLAAPSKDGSVSLDAKVSADEGYGLRRQSRRRHSTRLGDHPLKETTTIKHTLSRAVGDKMTTDLAEAGEISCTDKMRASTSSSGRPDAGTVKVLDLVTATEDGATGSDTGKDQRQSGRLGDLAAKAAAVVTTTTSTLGKRSRDAFEFGKDKLSSSQKSKRKSLRPRTETGTVLQSKVEELKAEAAPPAKKLRSDDTHPTKDAATEEEAPPAPKPLKRYRKKYLTSGLYAGQSSNFDARLTEKKNKLKQSSRAPEQETKPERTILPMPMFGGRRLLDSGRFFKLPFDVFSPLPPGQPKPDEWRKTQSNRFVGDSALEWKRTKPLEFSKCLCTQESGCDDNCQNRFMLYECDSNNCAVGEHCGNRAFTDLKERHKRGNKYDIGVEVIKTAEKGFGVRSNRTFEPNQIIVEYAGEIITQDEAERRMINEYKDNECYYLMMFDQNMIIDGTRGSIARFVNHSCAPNCTIVKWIVAGKPRMALFAGDEGIMTGEELTYDYNFDPFSQKNVQSCKCGAANCRGVLGPRPKDRDAKAPKKESVVAGVKRKMEKIIEKAVGSKSSSAASAPAPPSKKRKLTTSGGEAGVIVVETHSPKKQKQKQKHKGSIPLKQQLKKGYSTATIKRTTKKEEETTIVVKSPAKVKTGGLKRPSILPGNRRHTINALSGIKRGASTATIQSKKTIKAASTATAKATSTSKPKHTASSAVKSQDIPIIQTSKRGMAAFKPIDMYFMATQAKKRPMSPSTSSDTLVASDQSLPSSSSPGDREGKRGGARLSTRRSLHGGLTA